MASVGSGAWGPPSGLADSRAFLAGGPSPGTCRPDINASRTLTQHVTQHLWRSVVQHQTPRPAMLKALYVVAAASIATAEPAVRFDGHQVGPPPLPPAPVRRPPPSFFVSSFVSRWRTVASDTGASLGATGPDAPRRPPALPPPAPPAPTTAVFLAPYVSGFVPLLALKFTVSTTTSTPSKRPPQVMRVVPSTVGATDALKHLGDQFPSLDFWKAPNGCGSFPISSRTPQRQSGS